MKKKRVTAASYILVLKRN